MNPGDKLTVDELNTILNSWQHGSHGHDTEKQMIEALDQIGSTIGYGAMHQLAGWMYEIQCHGDMQNAVKMKRSRFKSLGWKLSLAFEKISKRGG